MKPGRDDAAVGELTISSLGETRERLLTGGAARDFALFLILLTFTFWHLLSTRGFIYERDTTLLEIPSRVHTAELLRQGHFALWSDARGNGQPFLANPKNAVLYPGTWLALAFSAADSLKIETFVHLVLSWIGLYVLIKAHGLSAAAAFFGASSFHSSGITLSSLEFTNHLASFAWMFWILALLRRTRGFRLRRVAGLSIAWAMLYLSGTPHLVVMTAGLALLQEIRAGDQRRKRLAMLAAAAVLGALVSAAQTLPAVELAARAGRAESVPGEWSLEPVQLLDMIFPGILGNPRAPDPGSFWGGFLFDREYPLYPSLYIGSGLFLLAFFAWRGGRDKRRLMWLAAGAGFLLLAAGRYLPPVLKLQALTSIRYPVKYVSGVVLCLVFLAALGFDRVFSPAARGAPERAAPAFWGALIAAAAGLGLSGAGAKAFTDLVVADRPEARALIAGTLLRGFLLASVSLVLLGLARRFPKHRPRLGFAFAAITLIDLAAAGAVLNPVVSPDRLTKPSLVAVSQGRSIHREESLPRGWRDRAGGGPAAMRYLRDTLYPQTGLGDGIRYLYDYDMFGAYDGETTAVLERFREMPLRAKAVFLRNTGCDIYVGPHSLPGIPAETMLIAGDPIHRQILNPDRPLVTACSRILVVSDLAERIEVLSREELAGGTAVVDAEIGPEGLPVNPELRGLRILENAHGLFRCSLTLDRRALVVLPGRPAPGWKAWVDGEPARLCSVNLQSKGLVVPEGRHDVKAAYAPASFTIGWLISCSTLLGVATATLRRSTSRGRDGGRRLTLSRKARRADRPAPGVRPG